MANKVQYGLKNVYYASVTVGTNTVTYGTPVAWPGAVSLSLSAEGDTNDFYADNIKYFTAIANNGYSGDFESALIPETFRTDIMGETLGTGAKTGMIYEHADVQPKAFALLFQFEGDDKATRHVLYNVTCNRPSITGATTEETLEPQTETVNFTAITIHNAALNTDIVKASCSETQSTQYSGWTSTVYSPVAPSTST